jgi:sulfate transport system ATP-binding protein
VSAPYIVREVIPVMEAGGAHEEEAARVLGASGLQTFLRVTLPNIKWGVLYGVILCSARVIGEFGAVSVVSGRIRGMTSTLPLHIEILYNEHSVAGGLYCGVSPDRACARHAGGEGRGRAAWLLTERDGERVSIEVRNLHKSFGGHVALDDVSMTVRPGELVALLGPSGSGKTTLLRVIAGLEAPDAGTVLLDGADAGDRGAGDRRVGFVFQHYALFRHLSVFENVAFGLRVRSRRRRPAETEIRRRVNELLSLMQLDYLGERRPSELSGGQRQRVALARALAVEPGVLLLDEPFGALDARVRQELRRWLRRLHGQMHLTIVFVTHDQEEALELADRVVVMNDGRVEQDGTPDAVVEHPASAFVMTFVGQVNIFRGRFQHGRGAGGSRG